MKNAFLAMPVSDNLASTGEFRAERRAFFERFVDVLSNEGFAVSSAGTNENWGKVKLPTRVFTEYDIDSILNADILIVVTNERLNRDMYLEMGLALGRGMPIIVVMPASTHLTFMGLGLEEMGLIHTVRYDSDSEAAVLLSHALKRVIAGDAGA